MDEMCPDFCRADAVDLAAEADTLMAELNAQAATILNPKESSE